MESKMINFEIVEKSLHWLFGKTENILHVKELENLATTVRESSEYVPFDCVSFRMTKTSNFWLSCASHKFIID